MEPVAGLARVATRPRFQRQSQVRLLDDIRGRSWVTHSPSRESSELGSVIEVSVGDQLEGEIYGGTPLSGTVFGRAGATG